MRLPSKMDGDEATRNSGYFLSVTKELTKKKVKKILTMTYVSLFFPIHTQVDLVCSAPVIIITIC